MKIITIAILTSILAIVCKGQGVKFETALSWSEVQAKAKAENKYIFMDIYATWCVPCKGMESDVYPSEKLGTFMNKNFISIKVQSDRTKNDDATIRSWYFDAQKIGEDYKVSILPTFLFFAPDGRVVNKGTGYKDVEGLIQVSQESLDPEKQYYTLLKGYKNQELKVSQFPNLAKSAASLNESTVAQSVADDYINNYLFKLKTGDLYKQDNLQFIGQFMGGERSKSYQFYKKNVDKINDTLGNERAEYAIKYMINRNFLPSQETWEVATPNWDSLENLVERKFGELGLEVIYGKRMMYNLSLKKWAEFEKYYVLYFEKALKRPDYMINNVTWPIFEHTKDKKILEFASEVMKYCIETWDQANFPAYDTYANLLYKLGNTNDAIRWEERALNSSKGTPDEKGFAEVLEKMKKNEKTWSTDNNN